MLQVENRPRVIVVKADKRRGHDKPRLIDPRGRKAPRSASLVAGLKEHCRLKDHPAASASPKPALGQCDPLRAAPGPAQTLRRHRLCGAPNVNNSAGRLKASLAVRKLLERINRVPSNRGDHIADCISIPSGRARLNYPPQPLHQYGPGDFAQAAVALRLYT